MDRRALGSAGEDAACDYLRSRGYAVLARNVRRREGEIDVVARKGRVVAFVEVKTRRSLRFGVPSEAVTYRKRTRIRGLAAALMAEGLHAPDVRFDVIEVVPSAGTLAVRHIEGAF